MAGNPYVRIVLRWWWLVAAVAGVAVAASAFLVSRQAEVYSSSATFVVRPHPDIADESIRAIDTLSRRVEILSTYADISESKHIRNQAIADLAIGDEERRSLRVNSRVVTGTNILRITGEAARPELAQEFIGSVANETVLYITSLDDIFTLQLLDAPSYSSKPISPQTRSSIVLGGILGLALGAALAVLAELLWRKPDSEEEEEGRATRRLQDEDSGAYGRRHFGHLVSQAALRAQRGGDTGFTVAVYGHTKDGYSPGAETLRAVAGNLEGWLRTEDVLGHLGGGNFCVLLPHTEPEETETHVERYRLAIEQVFKLNGAAEGAIAVGTVRVPVEDDEGSDVVDGQEITSMALHALTVARIFRARSESKGEPDGD